jgi:hypothetical protein
LPNEDSRDRERTDAGADTDEITEQDAIDAVLLAGNHVEGGKQRIVDYFYTNESSSDRAEFLIKEYSNGGGSVFFPNNLAGWEDHSSKGIEIFPLGYGHPSISLTNHHSLNQQQKKAQKELMMLLFLWNKPRPNNPPNPLKKNAEPKPK